MTRTTPNLWLSFFQHEKIDVLKVDVEWVKPLMILVHKLSEFATPKYRPYAARLETRRILCTYAMDLGIDLPAIRHNGKVAMGRGLLDIWMDVYAKRFGSNHGTNAWAELKRRGVSTKLSKEKE